MRRGGLTLGLTLGLALGLASHLAATAQTTGADPASKAPFGYPVGDRRVFVHALLSQFEGRFGAESSFRYEGEGWVGNDFNRVWLKSEGTVTRGRLGDGQSEVLYSRPISSYFDLQAGGRYDLDSSPGRGWAALGVEGFAPYLFTVGATAYAGEQGRFAFKFSGANEIRFSQRLILEPQVELNLYTKSDPARGIASYAPGLDLGLRLRYEITRKLAPYIGATYEDKFGRTGDFARVQGRPASDLRIAVGVRGWL